MFFQKLEPYPLASHGWRSPSKGSAKLPDLSCVLAIQMLIPTKHQHEMLVQTQRTDQWLSKGRGWGGVGWGSEISGGRLLDAGGQQGPTAQQGELHSVSDDKPQWKRIWKRTYVFVYIHKHPFSTT